jgi:anti-anti-sigma regulatory factor
MRSSKTKKTASWVAAKRGECRISLPAQLDAAAADRLHAALVAAAGQKRPVVIDAERVASLSTICLQALLAAANSFRQRNIPFLLWRPSDSFVAAFDGLGLFSALMSWEIRQ